MTDPSDYFRGYARDVGVAPLVAGADNVQDALSSLSGAAMLGTFSDEIEADAPTVVTADGTGLLVPCLVAAPPTWMDNAGNITAPGLYAIRIYLSQLVAPTVPGLILAAVYSFRGVLLPLDSLPLVDTTHELAVFALANVDLPMSASCFVKCPTDVTATINASIFVTQLASA